MNGIHTMKRAGWTASTLAALTLAAVPALADRDSRSYEGYRSERYDYARVVDVQPIMRQVSVETPVRECWEETRYREYDHYDRRHRSGGAGGAIAGGIIGGVIGHQFGSGRGNDAMTVLGTLIGAAVGSDSGRGHHSGRDHRGYSTESYPVERCDVRYETRLEERIDGYRVTYVYNGQRLTTRMPNDPGDRIRVRVSVRPAG